VPAVVGSSPTAATPHVQVDPELPSTTLPPPPSTKPAPARKAGNATGPHSKFLAHEEAFFQQERHYETADAPPAESFADLDEGHPAPRPGFWRRLLRKLVPSP
jgi:hypothetical protein